MAELWDRIRNVWDRNLEAPAPAREENYRSQHQLAAQQMAARDEVALEVVAALRKIRAEIRQDWTQEALAQADSPVELANKYQSRIDDYNRVAMSLLVLAEDRLSVNVANLIHPEEMARGIRLSLEQAATAKEQVLSQSIQMEIPGRRLQEQVQELRESWAQDLRSNQMRPADADLYYAGRLDQINLSMSAERSARPEWRESAPEFAVFTEIKSQVQAQAKQTSQQAEAIAV